MLQIKTRIEIMNIKLFLLVSVFILLGCNSQSGKTNAQDCKVNYESYYNERYDYGVDYPDFLIPQGESENQDGQTFLSDKGKMIVYRTFKAITGENPPVESAFEEDLEFSENVTEKQLFDNYYFVKGKKDENTFYKQYTILANDDYFVIYFEYSIDDEKLFECISQYVSESFNVGGSNEDTNEFVMFLDEFLNDCFWNLNLTQLLIDNDKRLAKYIDPRMDIRRYYNPNAVVFLYTREHNLGFDDYFDTKHKFSGEFSIKKLPEYADFCEMDFNQGKGSLEIYYAVESSVPDEVENSETLEIRPVILPYPDAAIMAVYLPNYFINNLVARKLYFVETPSGWKLAFVDDSICSA